MSCSKSRKGKLLVEFFEKLLKRRNETVKEIEEKVTKCIICFSKDDSIIRMLPQSL